ncbi:MAG: restriction endonuclease, partial [Saprospiraceae bacterium]|nr:restriction endonuclease [Saprospiraceae bacterium]
MASYRIEGNIISSEILDKIAKGDAGKQAPKDFGLEPSASLRDEIARAWANAKDQYRIFQRRRETLKEGDTGASETRRLWMLPFFDFLGYQLANATAETVNGNSYAISHRAENLDGFPVHIMGCNQSLDEKPKQGLRISPHAIVQEYLNLTEHLFGIVTNGSQLRLLRDASRLTRLSFLEFDLVQMMEEDLYSDFALLYRCLHASRMPATKDSGDTSFIEGYHQDALDAGSRIRERLSKTVELTIHEMANGFLQHPANQALRDWADQRPNAGEELYAWMLKIIYRMLFLMVTEERDLIYPKPENEATPDDKDKHRRRRSIYYDYYSIQRLRRLSERRQFAEERHADLWKAMRICFRLFSGNSYGMALGIAPLNGELFGSHALGLLEQAELDNRTLLTCLRRLNYFENERGQQVRVNYGSLDVEEFGSVYEGLLEYKAVVENHRFTFQQGTGRSSSGSHYTPDELVHPLIKHSLDHLVEDKLKEADS